MLSHLKSKSDLTLKRFAFFFLQFPERGIIVVLRIVLVPTQHMHLTSYDECVVHRSPIPIYEVNRGRPRAEISKISDFEKFTAYKISVLCCFQCSCAVFSAADRVSLYIIPMIYRYVNAFFEKSFDIF